MAGLRQPEPFISTSNSYREFIPNLREGGDGTAKGGSNIGRDIELCFNRNEHGLVEVDTEASGIEEVTKKFF
jgi:hypothetical protein